MKKNLMWLLASCLVATQAFAQTITIQGSVTEAANGEAVIGAVVMIKGSQTAVTTDYNGAYSIAAKKGDVLVCSLMGFKDKEATVGAASRIDFALEVDAEMLEETVVVGYGTLKKTQLVGSVENLSGEAIADRPNANVARSLQGQVAGLNIIQTDGKASHTGKIYVRGNATSYYSRTNFNSSAAGAEHNLGSGGSALILIDGVEGDLTSVNPADIETVAVLKDASSSAIYGARAAYGVILVTTKDAKGDKVSVTYNGSYSYNTRTVKWEDNVITDGLEWTEAFFELYKGNALTPTGAASNPTTANTQNIGSDYLDRFRARRAYEAENGVTLPIYNEIDGSLYNGAYSYFASTNWLAEYYKRHTGATTHDINIKGASKKINYSLTGRYFTQDGVYKVGMDDYNTFNLRSKVKIKINNWLSFDNNTSMFRSNQLQSMFTTGSVLGHQIDQHGAPIFVPYNEDGTYTLAGNKAAWASFVEGNTGQKDNKLTLVTSTGMTLDIIKDVLKIRGDFSYKAIRDVKERYRAPLTFWLSPTASTEYVKQNASYKSRWTYDTDYLQANTVLTWTPKINKNHDLNVVAGWNLEDYRYQRFYFQRKGYLFDNSFNSFELMDDGGDVLQNGYKVQQDNSRDYSIIGLFTRANYTLLGRYIIEGSVRYDGSSKFPTSQQWGIFPSASFGWRLSEEPWMQWSRSWMDNFKVRANYGSLGNGSIKSYLFMEMMDIDKTTVAINGGKQNMTVAPSPIPDSLTWETITTKDFGIDADFLHSRLSFSGDVYVKDTYDLITAGPEIPAVYGANSPKGNYAALQTKGWELTLSWRDALKLGGKDFSYSVKGSLWDTRTWVTKMDQVTNLCLGYYEGKELGEIWGFRTDGLLRNWAEADNWAVDTYHKNGNNFREYAGDLKFVDINGDGKIGFGNQTVEDHGDLDRIGNVTPRYQYGINLDFKWNGIGLSLFFQGVGKRDWYPNCETAFFYGGYNRPYSSYLMKTQVASYAKMNYYNEDGSLNPKWEVTNWDENPYWSRRVGYSANRNVGPLTVENDHYLQNAAYLRLKNLTVDYNIPESVMKKIGASGARVYCTMENLFTWSPMFKYTDMFDPEVITNGDSDFDSASVDGYGLSGVGEGMSYPMLKTVTLGVSLTF